MFSSLIVFFFFQAEDGIRDWSVTGVQTCALPISLFDGEHRFPWDEAVTRPVVQRMDVVVRRRFVDEHYAGPPEVEHALDLLNRALEDLAHVHRGVDQGRQLPDNREASRRRAGAARLHRSAVFARGEVELPDGRGGGGPLLGQRHPALQPAAGQVLEIARHVRQPLRPEARGRPRERVRGTVQRLRVLAAKAALEPVQRRAQRLDARRQPGRELGPHRSEWIDARQRQSSRTWRASSSGWNGLRTTPAAPVSAQRAWFRSGRAVSSTIGTLAVAASAFSRRHTSYPSISGIMTSTRITSSVVALRASSMPAAPDPAVTTSQPAVNSSVRRTSRSRSGSSSMISARKGSAIGPGCARGCRQY